MFIYFVFENHYLLFYKWQVFSQKSGLDGLFLADRKAFLFSPHHCYHTLVTLLMKGIRSRCFFLKGEISLSQICHQGSEHHAKEQTYYFLFFSHSARTTVPPEQSHTGSLDDDTTSGWLQTNGLRPSVDVTCT